MLLIASWHSSSPDERALRLSLSSLAEQFFQNSKSSKTHGQRVRDRFSAGGIVDEAIGAYPSLFEAALPAYRAIRAGGGCGETASFAMLASLMQSVEDTTTLHRGGQAGLERIKRDGKTLAQMIWQGENWRPFLYELNRAYIQMNLTIGGVADMLGIGYGWLIVSGEILIGDAGTSVGLDRPAQLAA
jgi:triphosphoribosyl-dephospho-CoA synthase